LIYRPLAFSSQLSTLLIPAVVQVLLGVRSEARWLRLVPRALPGRFRTAPAVPEQQAGA